MKLLSIIGYDRSGTTFLGSYLSSLGKRIAYVGEIDKALEILGSGQDEKCTCGEQYLNCPLWGKIDQKIKSGGLTGKRNILLEIERITQADLIIDTSKDLNTIKEFSHTFKNSYYTIHVKRNPKGVILSRMKNRKRRVLNKTHPKPFIASRYNTMLIYDSLEWSYRNLVMEIIKRGHQNLNITYDLMETELPEKVTDFYSQIGIEIGKNNMQDHVLWGNLRRLNFEKKIKINDSWKTDLNIFQRWIVDGLTFPLRWKQDYSFK